MDSIAIAPEERKSLIVEMKREATPSRRLRMHIALLASDGLSPTEISRVLFCSRATLYAVASRGTRPSTTAESAARGRCSPRRRTSASSASSKKTRPPLMAGCARAGVASSSPSNF